MNRLNQYQVTTLRLVIGGVLACFFILPIAQAVVPPPDGGYPNFTTAEGANALRHLTTGAANTAVGWYSLFSNTGSSYNTAVGAGTLLFNTADNNTALGAAALLFNTTGSANTATGVTALLNNSEGVYNTANGAFALLSNTIGNGNTANGYQALYSNSIGVQNTANGVFALFNNTIGLGNTAIGVAALNSNTTGNNNIALGVSAGSSLTIGSNNIDIGNTGVVAEANTIRIGSEFQARTFIAAIRGVTTGVADAVNVVIDSNGQLGTMSSSRRFKKEIKPIDKTSEAILALKPVTFHYKSDKAATPQFGLIAEEVAAVSPDLVVRDENGEIYTVRYEAVNAMLLNEFLKEHRKVEQLKKDFESKLAEQQTQIEALTAGVQKISAQIEMSKVAPNVARNKP